MAISLISAQVIGEYLRWMRAKQLASGTIRTARYTLHGLARRIDVHVLDAGRGDLEHWQAVRAEELSPGALVTQCSTIRNFYAWAVRSERITSDPSVWLEPPRAPRRLPRPMPDNVFAAAMSGADDYVKLILMLAGFAGLRACEIAGLDWSEVQLAGAEPLIVVAGKGGHERVVPLSPPLVEALNGLPRRRGPVVRRLDGAPGRVHPNRLSQIANEHLHGLDIPLTLHTLRHRFGTVVNDEAGLRTAQEALGHASPTTTAIYTKVGARALRSAVTAAGRLQASGAFAFLTVPGCQ